MPQSKIRFKFTKTGELKYLSHLDIARIVTRAIARADIKVEYSHGFNPKPRINFSNPTPLGVESLAEYCDIMLKEEYEADDFMRRLGSQLMDKMKLTAVKEVKHKAKSLMADIAVVLYRFKLGIPEGENIWYSAASQLDKEEDIKKSIWEIKLSNGRENFSLLKLYGYAKILKNKNNGIFKYNYFYDYFTGIAKKYSIDIYSVVKEEMFVLRDGMLKLPMEVI